MLLGALEAGGTKMVLGIGNERLELLDRVEIPTRTPDETIPRMIRYFRDQGAEAIGIGSFGPLDLKRESKTFGSITTTPKPGWANVPLTRLLTEGAGVPAEIDTDVNAAALGEWACGAAKGLGSCLYVTIGTGIGGGLIIEGNLVHGLVHPEFGHMLLKPDPSDPAPDGFCPYHRGCLEGLASGPAVEKRWGENTKTLPDDHPAWKLESEYLAQMCANAILCFSPERIVLGGGVMHRAHIFPMIRRRTLALLGGYVKNETLFTDMDNYIVSPGLGDQSGITGALILAKRAFENRQ